MNKFNSSSTSYLKTARSATSNKAQMVLQTSQSPRFLSTKSTSIPGQKELPSEKIEKGDITHKTSSSYSKDQTTKVNSRNKSCLTQREVDSLSKIKIV